MYILGHLITARESGRFSWPTLLGPHGPALYLPDFCRCHGWGYENCFSLREGSVEASLIKAHLLGDWWVHHGPERCQGRRGWAYRHMAPFAVQYKAFLAKAEAWDLLKEQVRDSVRGFSHTMAEYAIDVHVAGRISDAEFTAIKDQMALLAREDSPWSLGAIARVKEQLSIRAESGDMAADVNSFRSRVSESRSPEEFVYRAGAKKFGLRSQDESLELVAEVIHSGLERIPAAELDQVVAETSSFIRECTSVHWGD